MSLTKLFSKNYAIQNMKKSKGILSIMLIAISLITFFCLYSYDNSDGVIPFNMEILIIANYIGMFIIPFVLSNVLLGYVYHKNSIDFINSMPMSRKKIYLTNIITGILYLIILQFVNFLVASSYVLIVESTSFSIAMIWDGFVVMTVGYIFTFVISLLALTISGNKFTQIIVALLILFLIPFIKIVNFPEINNKEIAFINFNGVKDIFIYEKEALHTVPTGTFVNLINLKKIYKLDSISLTLALSIIYALIGMKLFEKRKMENTGSSFESVVVHLMVKAITLYPMIVFLNEIHNDIRFLEIVLIVFLIFIYYFVYDLITNKKIRLKVTIGAFIFSCILLVTINFTFNFIDKNVPKNKDIYANDIVEAELELSEIFYDYSRSNADLSFAKLENKEILNFILSNIKSSYTDVDYSDAIIETVQVPEEIQTKLITLKITLNNGRNIKFSGILNKQVYIELLDKILADENYIKNLAENYKIKRNTFITYDRRSAKERFEIKPEDKLAQSINNNIESYIRTEIEEDNLQNKETYKRTYYYGDFDVYNYDNHNINMYSMRNELIDEQVFQELVKIVNNNTKKNIEEIISKDQISINSYFNFNKYEDGKEKEFLSANVSAISERKIIDIIKKYENNFDACQPYYEIRGATRGIRYYTNNITEIQEIIQSEKIEIELVKEEMRNIDNNEITNDEEYMIENIQVQEMNF